MKLTNLNKKDFNKILENYDIGEYKSHEHIWWAMANTVYKLKTTKDKFILKVFEKSNLKFIRQQLKVIDFLFGRKIPVPEILKTKQGKNLVKYNGKNITIEKYIGGKEPKSVNMKLTRNLGKNIGLLDKNLLEFELEDRSLNQIYAYEELNFYNEKLENIDLEKAKKELFEELNSLNKNKLRKSIIHGDICHSNILVKNNKLKMIIDWDDFHRDFIVYGIAVAIAHFFVNKKRVEKKKIQLFLKEYQKQVKLNSEELKALYYFIKQRILAVIVWCIKQKKEHKDETKKINKWLNEMVGKYRQINKLKLEEFEELK